MKKLLLTTLLCLCASIILAQTQTTFILVRHAEKANDGTRNPPLTEEGVTRSEKLAEMLSRQEIGAIYSTPYKRTKATVQQLSNMKNLEVQEYDPSSKGEWLETLAKKHAGGTVVISGHSNTIPGLANALLGDEKLAQFDESDYSNLLIIVTSEVGKGKLVRLSY